MKINIQYINLIQKQENLHNNKTSSQIKQI